MAQQPPGSKPPIRPVRTTPDREPASDQLEFELVRFGQRDNPLDLRVDFGADTVWATRGQMADLFGISPATVTKQLDRLKQEGALGSTRAGNTATGDLYDLDTILCIGYRVSSAKASTFRRWAGHTLRSSAVDGFAINDARLRDDPAAADRLAARLRGLRADEANIYETVRAFFREAAADHDADSPTAQAFRTMLQDKFIFAVTGKRPSDVILERADHHAAHMGLHRFAGDLPTIDDARMAANYLDGDELFVLHILCEQFLLYIQGKAARARTMTMRELGAKLDDLLRLDDVPILPGHKDLHKERAVRHAQAEYARFILREERPRRLG